MGVLTATPREFVRDVKPAIYPKCFPTTGRWRGLEKSSFKFTGRTEYGG